MNGDGPTSIEDIVRRNIAALRSRANLTQQALADEMLARGVAWTRETVAQVETTNRRIGLTEAIAVAACLDVPLARLTATGADTVTVGESRWTTVYLSAAIAGTVDDLFGLDSYAGPARTARDRPGAWSEDEGSAPPLRPGRRRTSSSAGADPVTAVPWTWPNHRWTSHAAPTTTPPGGRPSASNGASGSA